MMQNTVSSAQPALVGSPCPSAQADSPRNLKPTPWSVDCLAFRRLIGRGYASRVWECIDRGSGDRRAVKVYRKRDLCPLNLHQIRREALIHSSISHPSVLPFYGSFSDANHVYMVLDYCAKGDLYNYLRAKRRSLTESQAAKYVVKPFLETLAHLHAAGIVHRDIKPENILVTDAGTLLLADFGLSIRAQEDPPVTRVGTLDYMAPEVVRCPRKSHAEQWKECKDLVYGASVDVWALGVLVYELIVGTAPFAALSKEEVHQAIVNREPQIPDQLSSPCADFMRLCMRKNADERPSAERLYEHPWVARFTQGRSVFNSTAAPIASTSAATLMREGTAAGGSLHTPAAKVAAPVEAARCRMEEEAHKCGALVRPVVPVLPNSAPVKTAESTCAPRAGDGLAADACTELLAAVSMDTEESNMSNTSAMTLDVLHNVAAAGPL